MEITKIAASFLGLVAVMIIISLVLSYPIMLLWNACLVPAIPAIHEVQWMQMFGIMTLVSVLFKSTSK